MLAQPAWWHELNTWEPEIALAFYGRTLGWKFDSTTLPDGGSYWIARKEGRTYEPASELLARIKSERDKTAATPKATKRGKAVAGKK